MGKPDQAGGHGCPSFGADDRLELARREHPALYPFGTQLTTFLTADEERTASLEQRLRSSWRFMIGGVIRFSATLKPREAAVFDVEDVAQAVAERLVEKDHLWDPDRGRYSTFVAAVMVNILVACRDRARTISGPTNAAARMAFYREKEADGSLTRDMRRTMVRLERAMEDVSCLEIECQDPEVSDAEDPIDMVALRRAIRRLDDPLKAWILVRKEGLMGNDRMSYKEIARRVGISELEAKRIARHARNEIKEWILVEQVDDNEGEEELR